MTLIGDRVKDTDTGTVPDAGSDAPARTHRSVVMAWTQAESLGR